VPLRAPVELDEAEGAKFKALQKVALVGSEIIHRLENQLVARISMRFIPVFTDSDIDD
jgi:hypothetical protein